MKNSHNIYLISDSTGETLDRIFLALKAQFESFDYQILEKGIKLLKRKKVENGRVVQW